MERKDQVSNILEQWKQVRPDLDVSPMGVIGRLSRLARVLERELEATFATFGLSIWGFDVLATLRRSGPPYHLSPTQLFQAMMVTSGTMTNRIDRLEQEGLVARFHDPDDRRGILVGLTSKGLELVDTVVSAHVLNEKKLLEGLSSGEQADLAQLLNKLLSSLEKTRA